MTVDFKQLLSNNGIPMTEAEATASFHSIAFADDSPFNNQSPYSPFWRLVSLFCVKPVTYLANLLHAEILPALFLKTATGQWVDMFAWQLGLERKQATKARGNITIERYSEEGSLTVPAGTVVQSALIGGETYRVNTLADLVFEPNETLKTIIAEAQNTGSAYNLGTGFYALMSTELSGLARAGNDADWLLQPGSDAEKDDELKERCRNQFAATNPWHVDFAYIGMLTKWAGVGVDDVFIDSEAPRGPGTANIYILFDQSTPAQSYLDQMQAYIMEQGNHGFSDDVLILPLPVVDIEQSATVELSDTLDDTRKAALILEITQFVQVAFRQLPNTFYQPTRFSQNERFRWSKLINELHGEFPDLESVDFANDDNIPAQLAQPNLINWEVVEA